MGDNLDVDLDQLLDEVEERFCSSDTPSNESAATRSDYSRQTTTVSELDRIISDICDDDPSINKDLLQPTVSRSTLQSHHSDQGRQKRCHSVFLGGATISLGHSEGTVQSFGEKSETKSRTESLGSRLARACDRLRCTSCDFQVIWFNDFIWHSRSEYLFFRNNVPDFGRLKKNLVRKKGSRAYACQCSWESVEGLLQVSSKPRLKWVCSKH